MIKQFLLISVFFLYGAYLSDWDLRKKSSGIEIYTRSIEGSDFEEFKGVTVISDVTLTEVLNVILDVENYDDWFPDCMNARILKQEGKWYDIHYIQTKGPLLVKNRDSIFEQVTVIDQDGKHARIILKSLPDYIIENEDMVRIRTGSGFWDLKEDNQKNVTIIYQFHGEPAGDIPSWMANSFVVSHPYETLKNLKSRLN
jgi:Polyketide cyclase / dehydrase and lipid transport